jgi:hypothetical protein
VGAIGRASRNCESPQDNDCDGFPDNTIDNVCTCAIGTTRTCGTHPEDGVGRCRAGEQRCEPGLNNSSSGFSQTCVGSVGPAAADSCSVEGDDSNCDGEENDGCVPTGSSCSGDSECSSGRCETWYLDRDGDGFGATDDTQRTCGSLSGSSLPPQGYVATAGDCCDLGGVERAQAQTIFPGQTQFFDVPQIICGNVGRLDFNCSGDFEFLFQEDTARGGGGCAFSGCDGATVWDLTETPGGSPPACGTAGPIIGCSGVSGACTATPQGFTLNFCH